MAALAVAAVALVVYIATLTPGLSWADWAEGEMVPHVLGIMHPTGYPVFTLLGWAWSWLPIGSVAYRANLLSAVCAALALAVGVLILRRFGVRPVVGTAAMLVIGFVPTIWLKATRAEVQTLHLLFVALILHRLLLWSEARRPRDLVVLAVLLGLAFGNHMATLTIAPFVVLAALWVGRDVLRARPSVGLAAAAAFLLALTPYLYLPIRAATDAPTWAAPIATLSGFIKWVTGGQYAGQLNIFSAAAISKAAATWADPLQLVLHEATPLFLFVAAIGAATLLRRRWGVVLLGATLIVVNVYIYLEFTIWAERERYLVTSWLILGLAAGVGAERLGGLAERVAARVAGARARAVTGASLVLLLALPVTLLGWHWSVVDQSQNRSAQVMVDAVLDVLPPNAVLVTYWDALEPLLYAQQVDGQRPDVLITFDDTLGLQAAKTRPLYLLPIFDSDVAGFRSRFKLTPVLTVKVAYGAVVAPYTRQLLRADPIEPAPSH